jgi:hypothetical protein
MPTVSRLANRGFLGVYVDLVHARQELEGLLGRRGLGRRLAEVVGLIQVLRRSRPHELILDGRRQRCGDLLQGFALGIDAEHDLDQSADHHDAAADQVSNGEAGTA